RGRARAPRALRRRGAAPRAEAYSCTRSAVVYFPRRQPRIDMSRRDELISLLATRSAKRGNFTLASGRQSTLYIDARITTMSPDGLALIGPIALVAIREAGWSVDAVGGLTMGADPIACAISYASASSASPLRAFTVRKEPKSH